MNVHLERALVLIQQGRWDLARKELEQALALEPDSAIAHSMLSHCFIQSDKPTPEDLQRATEEAEEAIRCEAGYAGAHAALARVMLMRNRFPEASAAAAEAIRIDPENSDYYVLGGAVEFSQSRWKEALAYVDRALQIDPENTDANNLRAMALVKLGRRGEAGFTIDEALRRNPEDADSHANKGWTLLEQGKPDEAMNHFKEALRLEPNHEWARSGIIEAIKARSFIYSLMLKYFLWMSRFSGQTQFIIMIGAFFLQRVVVQFRRANPQYALYCDIFLIGYFAFAIMTWVAVPLFNLILRTHPLGKYALNDDERRCSNWIGLAFFTAASLAIWSIYSGNRAVLESAMNVAVLVVPIVAIYAAPAGLYRFLMALVTLGMLGVVAYLAYLRFKYAGGGNIPKSDLTTYRMLNNVMFYGILGISIATGYLQSIPRRK